jgi:(1->4)-alpha-D-glucan 1-alpha-D-glucosylmutase
VQPVSTYRLQLTPDFDLTAAAEVVPYLADLGVTHVYCSPWLASERDSRHGYDVVDHGRVDTQLGGPEALQDLTDACREHGLGIVLDVVPNHMSVGHEKRNQAWWSLLRDGRDSPYAAWFDVDWTAGKLLLPVLGKPLTEALPELQLRDDRILYYDREFPLAPGTLVEGDPEKTLDQQHYRLAFWRASEELNYRRFFDVTTLAAVRVEDPDVFDATHALVLEQVTEGILDGLRIDHPDGLADPEGYLTRLADKAPGTWIIAEKILEPGERLPSWSGSGTTGYDALQQVMGLFVDPAGEQRLTDVWGGPTYAEVVDASKRLVLGQVLVAEVDRLVSLAAPALAAHDVTRYGLREAVVELLGAFDVYRAYVPAGGPADVTARAHVEDAVARASASLPRRGREIALVGRLALAELGCPEFVTRFQQTCGPVMAKGVEDTAFYRYLRLAALCEVGGDPGVFGISRSQFHEWCLAQQRDWPTTMTTLSTHDTKRSEDVRARLVLLSQNPDAWAAAVAEWSSRMPERLDRATEQLVWQSLVGAWPISAERAVAYLEKAGREAKQHTSWVDPDEAYEQRVATFARTALETLGSSIGSFVEDLEPAWRSTLLAQKLVQLTIPGVADTYQGTELVDLSLVDPDNRRPVDFPSRQALLATPDGSVDGQKLRLVTACLHLRREHPEWFLSGSYTPLEAGDDTLAFCRADQVVIAVHLRGGSPEGVVLPAGDWIELLPDLPVQLLVRRTGP